jgi:uncharacterized membrane protein (TIGR02234 family)
LATTLLLMAAAAGLVVAAASRDWETVRVNRVRPLRDLVIGVRGRTVEAGLIPLAVVLLAAILAILATSALPRRIVGGAVALLGAALLWRGAVAATGADNVNVASSYVTTSARIWPLLVAIAGVLVAGCGVWVVYRGARWPGMSRKYETPAQADAMADSASQKISDESVTELSDDAAWTRMDHGEDPTL